MKKGRPILDYFKEITIVVIGVLIAVSLDNYKERVDNEKYIEKTLMAIENDIKLSQSDLVLKKADSSFAGELQGLDDGDPELFYYKKLYE